MKHILQNNEKTKEYLDSLPRIYLVACWAHYGVREFPFQKFKRGTVMPMVWNYNDHNGYADQFELIPIEYTTTGFIYTWTFQKDVAEKLADVLEKEMQAKYNQT